jgi:cell fate (sporulation/competence/biofilm development) regulator YlbF (YheA/YmcA/DUF963 family)
MTVHDLAHELARAIKETEEYRDYVAAKERASQSPELTASLNDFQEKQFEMQRLQLMGEEIGPEVMGQVQKLMGVLMKDPVAAQYIQSEVRFSMMVNDVYNIIGEAVKG